MSMKHIIELQDLLDDPAVNGATVAEYLRSYGANNVQVKTLTGEKGSTDFIKLSNVFDFNGYPLPILSKKSYSL